MMSTTNNTANQGMDVNDEQTKQSSACCRIGLSFGCDYLLSIRPWVRTTGRTGDMLQAVEANHAYPLREEARMPEPKAREVLAVVRRHGRARLESHRRPGPFARLGQHTRIPPLQTSPH